MPQPSINTFVANNVRRENLLDSLINEAPIRIRNVHGFGGEIKDGAMAGMVTGVVNHIEHEDGSGKSFNATIGSSRIHISTVDGPLVFGLNHAHLRTAIPFTPEPPSWGQIKRSFLEGEPLIGRFSVEGQSLVLAGVVKAIQRGNESRSYLTVRIGDTLAQVEINKSAG